MAPPRRDLPLLDRPTELAPEYTAAGSLKVLAESIGASSATVRRAMIRHGIQRNQRKPSTASAPALDDATWLRARYASSTGVELAAELGVTPMTIYRALRRHGIEPRRQGHGQHQRRRHPTQRCGMARRCAPPRLVHPSRQAAAREPGHRHERIPPSQPRPKDHPPPPRPRPASASPLARQPSLSVGGRRLDTRGGS